mgnify:CR=1 FL=1
MDRGALGLAVIVGEEKIDPLGLVRAAIPGRERVVRPERALGMFADDTRGLRELDLRIDGQPLNLKVILSSDGPDALVGTLEEPFFRET